MTRSILIRSECFGFKIFHLKSQNGALVEHTQITRPEMPSTGSSKTDALPKKSKVNIINNVFAFIETRRKSVGCSGHQASDILPNKYWPMRITEQTTSLYKHERRTPNRFYLRNSFGQTYTVYARRRLDQYFPILFVTTKLCSMCIIWLCNAICRLVFVIYWQLAEWNPDQRRIIFRCTLSFYWLTV